MSIKEIESMFTHNDKYYILFNRVDSSYNYLYFFNPKNQNRSLLYGENLSLVISNCLTNPSIKCLECHLGSQILGAVSLDKGDIVQNNITVEEANTLLKDLKQKVMEQKKSIKLF
jgi:hypothetical protein